MIEIFHHHEPNFGDSLNTSLWKEVLPRKALESEKLLLVGVGSILNEEKLSQIRKSKRQIVILGSGASYGPVPSSMEGFIIKAVRGPLTARLIGQSELAITDSAALISVATGMLPPKENRISTLYIPHHHSAEIGDWQKAARYGGLEYVDPRWPVDTVLKKFATAKLVVTEAMHGAIFADSLRIPWIPVISSPGVDTFKWYDWTMSLQLPFYPIQILSSTRIESIKHRHILAAHRSSGVSAPADMRASGNVEELLRDYRLRYTKPDASYASPGSRLPGYGIVSFTAKKMMRLFDDQHTRKAGDALQKAALGPSFMSDDTIFRNRVDRLLSAIAELEKIA